MKGFKKKSHEIAKEVAVSKAEKSGKPSDFPFRASRNGGIVGVVTAQPNGSYRTTKAKEK